MIRYRTDIDGLRALAILPVVLFHAGIPGFDGGFVGVDIFFVISSFLITSIILRQTDNGQFSLLDFYERRARRILPALTVVILTTFAVGSLVLLPAEMDALGKSAVATVLFASNFHFAANQDYFAPAAELSPLLHSWSLAIEEQFYLLFPSLLLALLRFKRIVVFASLLLLATTSLLLAALTLPARPEWAFYLLPFRAWEFALGAILALQPARGAMARWQADVLGALGFGCILLPVIFYGTETAFPGLAALPPVFGTAAIILSGRHHGTHVRNMLSCRPLVWIGLISYSLYLWHWPVMALLRSVRGSVELPLPIGLCAVALSVGLAAFSYRFIERPFRHVPTAGRGRRSVFALSAGSLCMTAGIGAALALSDGAPWRISGHVQAVAAAAQDTAPQRDACFGPLPAEGLCRIGASQTEGKADFLLWGDSHALAILPGLEKAARRAGLSGLFAGRSACLPVPGLRRIPEDRACTELNQSVLAFLETRQDMPLVILSGRWTLSVEGTRFGEETGRDVHLQEIAGTGLPSTPALRNAEIVEQALGETVAALRANHRRVVILGPVPEAGWDVPIRMARSALTFGRPTPEPLSRAAHLARSGRTETLLARVADSDEGTRHISLSGVFCGEFCRTTDANGIPLYSDDNHLTRRAAEALLEEPLLPVLIAARQ
ncbi:acyltransferase family protein [Aliiruegeria lutimaris]|uniref:Peptidoglycan/LPS O-acetylase OafA/YrhL, contains acyltransferase and SGNH-hydrolase domains n=1 Tax=Aliiruegeria lutimaris TaxID=571298 RepID=A0A1G8T302_9RHOB|nr:acyltransferase family protein [Aliiruegeria lutimaris]SDJ35757.1 Peptidoglycan/LPS O-acetylase OafA/YrhL, contains acyltransferase and SGNH-hydrolase domains [Aliiruegeria lutimaris]